MKKSAYQVWNLAKEQNLTEEQTKELMIKEGIIIKKIFSNWNLWNKKGMPEFDGEYLCWIEQPQDCGNVHSFYKVVSCSFNTWLVSMDEFVIAWRKLDEFPFDEMKRMNEYIDVISGLVSDVDNLLSEHDIEWQQAGYLEEAKRLLKELRSN